MGPHTHILALLAKKLQGQPAILMPESLEKTLVELEEEEHKELAGFSNMLIDESLMNILSSDDPSYELVS